MSQSNVGGSLSTYGVAYTADGKQIKLGQMDRRIGIKIDFFGKHIDLTYPWTPRLWWYKYITYPRRMKKLSKEK